MGCAAQFFQVIPIMLRHRHWIDQNISAFTNPEGPLKIDVPFFVEYGPTEKVLSVKLFQWKGFKPD